MFDATTAWLGSMHPANDSFGADQPRGGSASSAARGRRGIARILRDRSGATAIEFALVSVPFFGLVFMIFQIALYHFALQSLDSATRQAARQVMIGKVPSSAQTAPSFRREMLCPKFLLSFSCDRVTVNAYKVEATSDANTNTGIYQFIDTKATSLRPVTSEVSFCLGGASDYVFLDVGYEFPSFLGSLLSAVLPGSGGLVMRSSAFVRNEPFSTGGMAC